MKKNKHCSGLISATLVMGFVMAGGLLLSCASYGVGAGYTSRTQAAKPNGGADMTDSNSSLVLSGSDKNSEFLLGFHRGTISAKAGGMKETRDADSVSMGAYFKYPFVINQFFSPIILGGFEYRWFAENKTGLFWNQLGEYDMYFGDFTAKIGAGLDYSFSKNFFIRGRLFYAPPIFVERSEISVSFSLGYRTDKDDAKKNWKTKEERTVEMVGKQGQKALDDKDYPRAIDLYTQGIAVREDNYPYYYKRSEAHAGAGDYAAALDDFNRATRINPVLQGTDGYQTWKQLVADYEKSSGGEAPMDDQGKLIAASSLKMASRNDSSWNGAGNGASYPAGPYTFVFWYENGSDKSGEASFTLDIEAGHVYYAEYARDGFTVTITIVDATERELRGGNGTTQIASKTVEIAVTALPSDLQLPSWVQRGLTEQQVRNRMGRAPTSVSGNLHFYSEMRGGTIIGYGFNFSGNSLISHQAATKANLNTVVNSFRKTIGSETLKGKNDDGNDMYYWFVPSGIRADILALQVDDFGEGTTAVIYLFAP